SRESLRERRAGWDDQRNTRSSRRNRRCSQFTVRLALERRRIAILTEETLHFFDRTTRVQAYGKVVCADTELLPRFDFHLLANLKRDHDLVLRGNSDFGHRSYSCITMIASMALKTTPLNAIHKQLGARMVDFEGWEMPVQYSGVLEEHRAVRERVGIFD